MEQVRSFETSQLAHFIYLLFLRSKGFRYYDCESALGERLTSRTGFRRTSPATNPQPKLAESETRLENNARGVQGDAIRIVINGQKHKSFHCHVHKAGSYSASVPVCLCRACKIQNSRASIDRASSLRLRSVVLQIIIQGFKSYKDQTIIEPFSPTHNVIGNFRTIHQEPS